MTDFDFRPRIVDEKVTPKEYPKRSLDENVIWTGNNIGGELYVSVCKDRDEPNCLKCYRKGYCAAYLSKGKER